MTGAASPLQITVFRQPSEAEADWRHFQEEGFLNPYQSYDWVSAWYDTLGKAQGIEALIAVVRKEGKAVALLPMGLESSAGIRTLAFLGHQNGNQNTGCWDADFYARASSEEMRDLLVRLSREASADLLVLHNVPETWYGRPHPFVLKGAVTSPSPVFMRALPSDFATLFAQTHSKSSRKKLLRKQRLLREAGDYRAAKAQTRQEISDGLAAFLEQRAKRAAKAGIPNAFSTPVARDFLSRLLASDAEDRLVDVWFLETGGAIRSTYLCIEYAGTIYSYSNSISHDDMEANSPGRILFMEIMNHACADKNLTMLDFGLGEEPYKTSWADPVPLKDSLLAVTWKGSLQKDLARLRTRVKSAVRNSTFLWPLVRRLRKWKAGLSKGGDQAD